MSEAPSAAGVTEAAVAACGIVEGVDGAPRFWHEPRGLHHALALSFAGVDGEGFGGVVYEDYAYFSAVVAVDGAGELSRGDAVAQCQAATRAHLQLIAPRGIATRNPVGTRTRAPGGASTRGSVSAALRKSMPAAPSVA